MEYMVLIVGLFGLIVVAPIIALVRTAALSRRLDVMASEIKALRREMTTPAERAATPATTGQPEPKAAPPPPTNRIVHSVDPWWLNASEDESQAATRDEPEPVVPMATGLEGIPGLHMGSTGLPEFIPTASPTKSRSREEWELIIGGNWLNRIGAIVILFFVGFLLKYAIDHSYHTWVTPWVRVVFGLLCGIGLSGLGVLFHRKGAVVFAQGIIGAGVSVLYLSAYASHNLYHLTSQPAAIALMSVVTAGAVTLAVRCNAISISLLGLLGGFLTPVLLSGGTGGAGASNGIGLLTYVALLDAGLLLVSLKRDSWAALEPLALVGTWVTYLVWRADCYTPGCISFTIPFLVIFWGLFYVLDVYRTMKGTDTFADLRMTVASLNSIFFYTALYYDVNRQLHQWVGLATILVAVAYFATVLVVIRRRADNPLIVPRYLITAIVLLAIATKVQFQGFTLSILWALESLALVWCGLHYRMKVVWGSALCLTACAIAALFASRNAFSYDPIRAFVPVLNVRLMTWAIVASVAGVAATLFGRFEVEGREQIVPPLHVAWITLGFAALTVETIDTFDKLRALSPSEIFGMSYMPVLCLTLGAVWMLYSLPLAAGGLWKRVKLITQLGHVVLTLGMGFLAACALEFDPIARFHPVLNARVAFLALAATVLGAHRLLLGRRTEGEYPGASTQARVIDAAIALLGFELVTGEIADYAGKLLLAAQAVWLGMSAERAKCVLWAAVWAAYSVPLIWLSVRKKHVPLAWVGSGLTVASVAAIAFCGAGYAPLSCFTTALNLRAGAFVVVVLALFAHRRQIRQLAEQSEALAVSATVLQIAASLLIFEVLTAETWVTFGKATAAGVPHIQSLQQLALSVVWVVYSFALLSFGIWRRTASLRYVAIAIYAVTIFKVFLSDLSFLDTLYRIFSFLALGLVLLVTSYLYQRFRNLILAKPEPPAP